MTEQPWLDEPDLVLWKDRATGFHCAIIRQPGGLHLCGYVGVPPEHKYHSQEYTTLPRRLHDAVHGGLTYAADHILPKSEPLFWWLGFDCAHGCDLCPGWPSFSTGIYRDFNFVRANVLQLAKELSA